MFIQTLLLFAGAPAGALQGPSILASVPDEAFSLVSCSDVEVFRQRLEANDWMRFGGTELGSPFTGEVERGWRELTRTDMEDALGIAMRLAGDAVLFQTREVWGFATEPPLDRRELAAAMRAWLPAGTGAAGGAAGAGKPLNQTVDVLGARVELAAWVGETTAYNARQGHFAAFVDAPHMMGLFSGDDSESLLRVVRASLVGSGTDHVAPIVKGFLAARTPAGARGVEAFIDFSPFVAMAEEELAREARGTFPDPTGLLGLEKGTSLYLALDVDRGSRVEIAGKLRIPGDTLAAQLADTFKPLPHTAQTIVPRDAWMVHALNWDVGQMYDRARAAVVAKHGEDSLQALDAGLQVAEAMSGVDPKVAILQQLAGTFTLFLAPDPIPEESDEVRDEWDEILGIGFVLGIVDSEAFLDTFETLIGIGGVESYLTSTEVEGAEAWLMAEPDEGVDGGLALLPSSFTFGLTRTVLAKTLRALNGVSGASLLSGARLAAAFDENPGACYVSGVELAPLKTLAFEDQLRAAKRAGDVPGAGEGPEPTDPFESILIGAAKRTKDGFELRLYTR